MSCRFVPSPSMAVSLLALVISLSGAAVAANGGMFTLGRSNSATQKTSLVAPRAGPALVVNNNSTASSATALRLKTRANRPPMSVTSSKKVVNLNADYVDGHSASSFRRLTAAEGPLAFTTTLSAQSNAIIPSNLIGFTATENQRCEVEAQGQFFIAPTAELGPTIQVFMLKDGSVSQSDNLSAIYFSSTHANISTALSRKAEFVVNSGDTVKFGMIYGNTNIAWRSKSIATNLLYQCFSLN